MRTTLDRPHRLPSDPLSAMGSRLAEKLAGLDRPPRQELLVNALHELLDGQDEAARQLRMAMQIHLVKVSNQDQYATRVAAGKPDEMLSTQAAAEMMGCSRPYVAMLIDAKKLAGGVVSRGGHRKVPKQSVLRWMKAHKSGADKDYKKAASDAGMYSVSEREYVTATRRKRRSAG